MATEKVWFSKDATPESAISKYAASPVRGMSNPPTNPRVRKALREYLNDNGVDPEPYGVESPHHWPPPQPPLGGPGNGWGPHSLQGSPTRARNKGGNGPDPPESLMAGMRGRLRGASSAPELVRYNAEPLRYNPLSPYSQRLHYGRGVSQEPASPKKDASRSGASAGKPRWHRTQGAAEVAALRAPTTPEMRGAKNRRDLPQEGRVSDEDQDGKEWKPKKPKAIITERHLSLSIESLRSQERLHRAATSDRFRFNADDSRSKTASIKGATAVEPQGEWESDASLLNAFHNSAMRTVNPSRLAQLPDLTDNKGKKKKKNEDDIDFIQVSDSGLFTALYPTDEALKSLRRLKRETFPKEKPPTSAPTVISTKIDLGVGFGDMFKAKKPTDFNLGDSGA